MLDQTHPRARRERLQRLIFYIATSLLLIIFPARAVIAQTPAGEGWLRGRVTDVNGSVLSGATITLNNLSTGLERVASADASGAFAFAGVREGRYKLTASVTGFAVAAKIIESVNGNSIDFVLEPAGLSEGITVVSGSRQEELRESLDTRVDVIGRNHIRDTGYETVAEVLQELPGVLTRRGTQGAGTAGEQIQGIDSRQVLVLYDGQPVIGARGIKRGGVLNLDRQSIGALERVEVVKGASSALYGSDAIGGVINQISREPNAPLAINYSASGGSQGRFDTRGDVSFARDRFLLLLSGERHKQNPFDLTPTTFDTTGAGFHRYDGFAKFKYKFTPKFSVSAWARSYWANERGRARGEEGNLDSSTDEDSQNYNVQGDWQANERTAIQARGYYARYDEITNNILVPNTKPVDPGNLFERYGKLDASISHILGDRQIVQAGGEWVTVRYRGFNRLANDRGESADTGSIWAQDKLSFNRITLTAGFRFDHHSIFGNAFSPKAGINVRVHELFRVRASYGRGFRAPDLGQLYYRFLNPTNFYQVIGNPNLKPEHANSVQLGGEFTSRNRRVRLGVNVFYNDVENLIDSVSLGFVTTQAQLESLAAREGIDLSTFRPVLGRLLFFYKNIAEARTTGVEFDGDVNLTRGFNFGGAYTYLSARDLKAGLPLTGRHKHQGHIRLAWESNQALGLRWNVRGTFFSKWINSIATPPAQDVIPPGFALWDFYGAKRIYRGLEVFGAVDNFTDSRDPNTGKLAANGTPLPLYRAELGRTFRVGMRLSWSPERK